MIQEYATFTMTTATLASNVAFVFFLVVYFGSREFKKRTHVFVKKYIDEILFVISFGALAGSLIYSNIIGFPPCELCWIQRIFMYPQVLIAAVSLYRKEKLAVYYALPLSLLGGMVSLFQSLTDWGIGGSLLPCTAEGGACSRVYVMDYGYITIPIMALTCFVYLLTVSWIYKKSK